ncbi:MAG TPA: phosphotransferase [Streptosporangiaceae bacterium]|nr:phosphotransferase [Streptosporangiaceae bacterium]
MRSEQAALDPGGIAAEFGLGRVLGAEPLPGGHRGVTRLITSGGTFVVKPESDPAVAELNEKAALVLGAAGIRQARPLRTTAGSLVSASGHGVEEFLPGRVCLAPTAAHAAAVMCHVADYHAALAKLPAAAGLGVPETVWTRVASARYLVDELPGLLRRHGPAEADRLVTAALGHLERALPQIAELPRQIVHGDIGPDNVLMDGDAVVAIVDFTPHYEPVLLAVATAVYWYHVCGRGDLNLDAIRASLAGYRPWTDAERAAWPAMLILEALRRLATPAAVAAEGGTPPQTPVAERYRAVHAIMRCWPRLPGLLPPRGP